MQSGGFKLKCSFHILSSPYPRPLGDSDIDLGPGGGWLEEDRAAQQKPQGTGFLGCLEGHPTSPRGVSDDSGCGR